MRIPSLGARGRRSGERDERPGSDFDSRVPVFQLIDRATGLPKRRVGSGSRAAAGLDARWRTALARYETVLTEWGAIVSDPLSALEHCALLDVTQPRTAAFVEALGRAQDRCAVLGSQTVRDWSECSSSRTWHAGSP